MRLIIDPPAPGRWNMAVDEMLLGSASESRELTLRIYRWSPATLSLGYFQSHLDRAQHSPSSEIAWVRRPSGGGAIVHDDEVTYSLAIPPGHRFARDSQSLYRLVHAIIVELLADYRICAAINETTIARPPSAEPFLCFQRRAVGDILIGHDKVVGSAQRKRHGTILQHGSILLGTSAAAPELPGIETLAARKLPEAIWTQEFPARLAERTGETLAPQSLNDVEVQVAQDILAATFDHVEWNEKR